jgi:hypothetical protein
MKEFKRFIRSFRNETEVHLPLPSETQEKIRYYLDSDSQRVDISSINWQLMLSKDTEELICQHNNVILFNFPVILNLQSNFLSHPHSTLKYIFTDPSVLFSTLLSASENISCRICLDIYLKQLSAMAGIGEDHLFVVYLNTIDLSSFSFLLLLAKEFKSKVVVLCSNTDFPRSSEASPPYRYSKALLLSHLSNLNMRITSSVDSIDMTIITLDYG